MRANDYDSLVEVFRGDLWEAELVKGLLASAARIRRKDTLARLRSG